LKVRFIRGSPLFFDFIWKFATFPIAVADLLRPKRPTDPVLGLFPSENAVTVPVDATGLRVCVQASRPDAASRCIASSTIAYRR
jgi:hypothetical protein